MSLFRFGEFAFDARLRQLLHHGEPRHLSPKAQQLLHLLLAARPRALSRGELYDALWPSTYVSDANLASIVNEVRRALGDDARSPKYIRTAHSFGYAFCGEVVPVLPAGIHAGSLVCDGRNHRLYEGENLVGRSADCGVVLAEPTVSRHHATITITGDEIWIKDLGSKNGTYLDGRRIGGAPVKLKPQMLIELGAVAVVFVPAKTPTTDSLRLNLPELRREVEARLATLEHAPAR